MLNFLKNQSLPMLFMLFESMLEILAGPVLERLQGLAVDAYKAAQVTPGRADNLVMSLFVDLITGSHNFTDEVLQAMGLALDDLYIYCVTQTKNTTDEHVVLMLFDAINREVPALDTILDPSLSHIIPEQSAAE